MSNFDKAVSLIYQAELDHIGHTNDLRSHPSVYVAALESAGLLTPDGEPLEETDTRGLVYRLQSAVQEMLESLNALEYSHYNTRGTLEDYRPSTIETYGLTKEDMQ